MCVQPLTSECNGISHSTIIRVEGVVVAVEREGGKRQVIEGKGGRCSTRILIVRGQVCLNVLGEEVGGVLFRPGEQGETWGRRRGAGGGHSWQQDA